MNESSSFGNVDLVTQTETAEISDGLLINQLISPENEKNIQIENSNENLNSLNDRNAKNSENIEKSRKRKRTSNEHDKRHNEEECSSKKFPMKKSTG